MNGLIGVIWQAIGRLSFWLTKPLIQNYLRNSQRTRIVISSGDKILVTKGWLSDGRWTLPGGGLHKGELPLDGVLRELHEETGLVQPPEACSLEDHHQYDYDGFRFMYDLFITSMRDCPPPQPKGPEIIAAAWLNRSQLTPKTAQPDVLLALQILGR